MEKTSTKTSSTDGRAAQILLYLEKHGSATRAEMCDELDIPTSSAYAACNSLEARGLVEREIEHRARGRDIVRLKKVDGDGTSAST